MLAKRFSVGAHQPLVPLKLPTKYATRFLEIPAQPAVAYTCFVKNSKMDTFFTQVC